MLCFPPLTVTFLCKLLSAACKFDNVKFDYLVFALHGDIDLLHASDAQDFAEKPKGDALKAMQVDTTVLGALPLAAVGDGFACTQIIAQELHAF